VTKGGLSWESAWGCTPRQLSAILQIQSRLEQKDAALNLSLGALAARGDPKEVKKQIEALNKD